uniref:Uncharacterized protein n=1 Tax=Rhizophora mucronata TaxID=61149 RepID=A0A2P2NN46_RHIMU
MQNRIYFLCLSMSVKQVAETPIITNYTARMI